MCFLIIKMTAQIETDIHTYCANCGIELDCSVRYSSFSTIDIDVDLCPACIDKYEDQINELKEIINDLKQELAEVDKFVKR